MAKNMVDTRVKKFVVTYSSVEDAILVNKELQEKICRFQDNFLANQVGKTVEIYCTKYGLMDVVVETIQRVGPKYTNIGPMANITLDSSYFTSLYQQKFFTDVVIKVKERVFWCHRVVLSAVSDYFFVLFRQDTGGNRTTPNPQSGGVLGQDGIALDDVDPDVFGRLIGVIYGENKETIGGVDGLKLLVMMDRFGIKGVSIDSYLENMQWNPLRPEELPEYFSLLNRLDSLGYGNDSFESHFEAPFDDYEDTEALKMAFPNLPKTLQEKYEYCINKSRREIVKDKEVVKDKEIDPSSPIAKELTIMVSNVSELTRTRDLEDEFGRYGRINNIRKSNNNIYFITFNDERDAIDARRYLDGRKLNGQRISIH